MRIGAAFFLCLVSGLVFPGLFPALRAGTEESESPGRDHSPRGPYLLRQIFGETPQSAASIWGLAPGILRSEVPSGTDLGREEKESGSPLAFTRDVSGRATVTFVFKGDDAAAQLDHITVTVIQGPNINVKSLLGYLGRIYGPADPLPADQSEVAGSWQSGAVLLRPFPAARFFEVRLSSPRIAPPKAP
jgi:hypothetical protein